MTLTLCYSHNVIQSKIFISMIIIITFSLIHRMLMNSIFREIAVFFVILTYLAVCQNNLRGCVRSSVLTESYLFISLLGLRSNTPKVMGLG